MCGQFNNPHIFLIILFFLQFWVLCKFVILHVFVLAISAMLAILSSHESISWGSLSVGGAAMSRMVIVFCILGWR